MASRLFSGQELSALRRDANFRRQVEDGLVTEVEAPLATRADGEGAVRGNGGGGGKQECPASGPIGGGGGRLKRDPIAGGLRDRDPRNWFEVSMKSVSLARKERGSRKRGNFKEEPASGGAGSGMGVLQASRSMSDIPRQDGGRGGADGGEGSGGGRNLGASRMLQETEASAMRTHARKREDEVVVGGAQNFYKPVRVCGPCFRVSVLSLSLFTSPCFLSFLSW